MRPAKVLASHILMVKDVSETARFPQGWDAALWYWKAQAEAASPRNTRAEALRIIWAHEV